MTLLSPSVPDISTCFFPSIWESMAGELMTGSCLKICFFMPSTLKTSMVQVHVPKTWSTVTTYLKTSIDTPLLITIGASCTRGLQVSTSNRPQIRRTCAKHLLTMCTVNICGWVPWTSPPLLNPVPLVLSAEPVVLAEQRVDSALALKEYIAANEESPSSCDSAVPRWHFTGSIKLYSLDRAAVD